MDDVLAEMPGGIKPKRLLQDGEEMEANSMTSQSVYKIKRTSDHYYCTCPAWRNAGGRPVDARTCKHLRAVLGDEYEDARLKWKDPDYKPAKSGKAAKATSASKAKATRGKRKKDDDEEDDDGGKPGSKRKKAVSGKGSKKSKSKSKDEEEEDDDDDEEEEEEEDKEEKKDKSAPKKITVNVLLAEKWDLANGIDPTGWWVSEKLDGVRVYYDGKSMWSRLGNPFTPPQAFLDKLPKDVTLDGELFGGRGKFQETVSIVKTTNSKRWEQITFQIFDVPSKGDEPFEDRMKYLEETFGTESNTKVDGVKVVQQALVRDRDHIFEMLEEVMKKGGEGLMIREPKSQYIGKRSKTLLKIKTFYDAEARVTGYVPGKGRHKGVMGAVKCEMASGKTFSVGSGFSDKQRKDPPKINTIITYRFQELTKDGVPRFPTFVGECLDKTEPTDADIRTVTAADD